MRYITEAKDAAGCVFCQRATGSGPNSLILHRDARTFTILNLYPYTTGHLMVIPYRHLPRFGALDAEERSEVARGLARAEAVLRRVAGARFLHAGINLGRAAGAGVEGHLHVHLVPRGLSAAWGGPEEVAGEDLPLPLEEVFARLQPHFARMA